MLQVVDWGKSRNFFYNRLKRRLAEEGLIQQLIQAAGGHEMMSHAAALAFIKEVSASVWDDDAEFCAWSREPRGLEQHLQELESKRVVKEMVALASSPDSLKALPAALNALLQSVSTPLNPKPYDIPES